jgi:hypothetical protein
MEGVVETWTRSGWLTKNDEVCTDETLPARSVARTETSFVPACAIAFKAKPVWAASGLLSAEEM